MDTFDDNNPDWSSMYKKKKRGFQDSVQKVWYDWFHDPVKGGFDLSDEVEDLGDEEKKKAEAEEALEDGEGISPPNKNVTPKYYSAKTSVKKQLFRGDAEAQTKKGHAASIGTSMTPKTGKLTSMTPTVSKNSGTSMTPKAAKHTSITPAASKSSGTSMTPKPSRGSMKSPPVMESKGTEMEKVDGGNSPIRQSKIGPGRRAVVKKVVAPEAPAALPAAAPEVPKAAEAPKAPEVPKATPPSKKITWMNALKEHKIEGIKFKESGSPDMRTKEAKAQKDKLEAIKKQLAASPKEKQ